MSQRIEGLFLRATKIKHNSIIVDLLTRQYGRSTFVFAISTKKNQAFLFQPFHFIEFSTVYNPEKKVNVGPSESMSKSKRNTIDPENIINSYGADSVRLFILSDSPPEKDVQWSETGMLSSYKFTQKLWSLHQKFKNKIEENSKKK